MADDFTTRLKDSRDRAANDAKARVRYKQARSQTVGEGVNLVPIERANMDARDIAARAGAGRKTVRSNKRGSRR